MSEKPSIQQPPDISGKGVVQPWTQDVSVLWRDGNWMKIFPNQSMSEVDKANAIARLGLLGGIGLAALFRSVIFVGLGLLLLLLSKQMIDQKKRTAAQILPAGQVKKRHSSSRRRHRSRHSAAKSVGAHVNRQQEITQVPPAVSGHDGPAEGSVDANLVPMSDVHEFQSGNNILRSPFPRPMTAEGSQAGIHSQSTIIRNPDGTVVNQPSGTWAGSYPYQTGFPTEFGPTPTAIPPSAAEFVRNVPGRPTAQQEAVQGSESRAPRSGEYQPGEGPITWGAFMSDGGNTSTPVTVPVPSGTTGSNFATAEYTPRNLAEAGEPIQPPPRDDCFAPDKNNLLANPPVKLNRVARPRLCSTIDPRSDSEKFVDGLYESSSTQAAGYNFFPFPVQDVVEARDNFQKWVVEDGQTHLKDRYTYPESAGLYNFTDFVGELGY